MPLPSPRKGQSKDDFVNICMDDTKMLNEFPDDKQRAAVCYSQYSKSNANLEKQGDKMIVDFSDQIKSSKEKNKQKHRFTKKSRGQSKKAARRSSRRKNLHKRHTKSRKVSFKCYPQNKNKDIEKVLKKVHKMSDKTLKEELLKEGIEIKSNKKISPMIIAFPHNQIKILDYNRVLKSNLNSEKIIKEDIRNFDKLKISNTYAIIHLANIANDPTVELNPNLSWEVNVLASKLIADHADHGNQRVTDFLFLDL